MSDNVVNGSAAPRAPSAPVERKPACRYFLLGDCRIRNCQFLHARAVCKFWLRNGECARGDQCMYRHELTDDDDYDHNAVEPPAAQPQPSQPHAEQHTSATSTPHAFTSASATSSPQPISSIWHRDDTSSTADTTSTTATTKQPLEPYPHQPDTWTMATKIKLSELESTFTHVPASAVRQTFIAAGCRDKETRQRLQREWPHTSMPAAAPLLVAPPLVASTSSAVTAPSNVAWVETGDAIATTYSQYRETAAQAAVQRNRLFDAATHAYLRGDKAAARSLSAEGRKLQAVMEEEHQRAATAIFRERNQGLQAALDLHGLHPNEAVDVLQRHVARLRTTAKNRSERTFQVITGTGNHSYHRDKPKVLPAVVSCLDRLHCVYRDVSPDGRGGLLSVVVPKS
mmetsp:Transcript_6407/g.11094  ORF Transcript_6407/g.11094 Transcript_6407/m.11094 type:complete len:399 (+) Transcript_6407:395-1591(+)